MYWILNEQNELFLIMSSCCLFQRDTKVGYSFSVPYSYDGLRFGGVPFYVQCADSLNTTGSCKDTLVCVGDGSTHLDILDDLLPKPNLAIIVPDTIPDALVSGDCNVIAGEEPDVAEFMIRNAGFTEDYVVGSNVFSKVVAIDLLRGCFHIYV